MACTTTYCYRQAVNVTVCCPNAALDNRLSFFQYLYAGGLPGPVLFGFALDHSCLLWEKKCDGSTGACLYYDNHQMAWLLFAICASCKVLTIVCGLLSWQMYMRRLRKGDVPSTGLEITTIVGPTGNGTTGNNAESAADQTSGINNLSANAETSYL